MGDKTKQLNVKQDGTTNSVSSPFLFINLRKYSNYRNIDLSKQKDTTKIYKPLYLEKNLDFEKELEDKSLTYKKNLKSYTDAIKDNKKYIQLDFKLSNDEVNQIAKLAIGIAENETQYGTSFSYNTWGTMDDKYKNPIKNGLRNNSFNSRGITQIKYGADTTEAANNSLVEGKNMKQRYKELGITDYHQLDDPKYAAAATMMKLAHVYKSEVKGKKFLAKDSTEIDPFDALIYKYNGKGSIRKDYQSEPDKYEYLQNAKKFYKNFSYFQEEPEEGKFPYPIKEKKSKPEEEVRFPYAIKEKKSEEEEKNPYIMFGKSRK